MRWLLEKLVDTSIGRKVIGAVVLVALVLVLNVVRNRVTR